MFTKNRTVLVRSLFLLSRFNNGALKDKKTETKSIGNDFVTIDTDVVVKIPKSLNNGVKIKYDGLNLKMKPLGLMSKNKTFATPEGNSYRYTDTYDVFTDIVYTPTFTGVKCDIVLEEYTGRNTFRFEIHTNGYCLEKDENEKAIYVKDDDGNRILCFNPVVSYDSAGNVSFGDISFQEQNGKNKYIITMTVDEAFLTDPNTVYPVVVDPTTSSTDYAQGDLEYLCVYSNGTSFSSKSSGSRPNMLVGSSSGSVIGRVLYRFGEISAKQIIKAELVQCAWTTSDLVRMFITALCQIKNPSAHMNTRTGTDVHNDTLANPHEIKVFGSRRIYFTEKI